jgi:hypothetical protein
MSRILRRPMFRGGRVDSRGTGIASGLKYKQGGRVGLKDSFPGTTGNAYSQMVKSNLGWKDSGIKSIPQDYFTKQEEWKQYTPKYPTDEALHEGYLNELENEQALIDSYMIEGPLTPDSDLYDRWSWLASPGGQKNWKEEQIAKQDADIAAAKAYDVNINTELNDLINKEAGELTQEQIIAQIRAEEEAKRQELIDLMNKKGTPEEEIEKNKKIFQKAYGSGVADDASRMLMSFAGKALKPGADTKSAFGEFFEEESKRPSESKKYKDAATTAAINAYLTGQSSFQKFEDQMKMMKAGVDYKNLKEQDKVKGYSVTDYVMADKKNSEGKAIEIATRKVMENKGIPGKINKISGKENTDGLLVEENVNKVFYDTDNKEVFLVTIVDGQIVKDYNDWYR